MSVTFIGTGSGSGGNTPAGGTLYSLASTTTPVTAHLTLTTHASTQVGDNVIYVWNNQGYPIADGVPDATEKTHWAYLAPPAGIKYIARYTRPGIGDVFVALKTATAAGAVNTDWVLTIPPLPYPGTLQTYVGCATYRGGHLDKLPVIGEQAPSIIASSAGELLICIFGAGGALSARGMTTDGYDGVLLTFLELALSYAGNTGYRTPTTDGVGQSWEYGISLLLTDGHPPTAATLVGPSGNVAAGSVPPATWVFNDPDPDDVQTSADIRFRAAGAGSWTEVDGAAAGVSSYAWTATFSTGTTYEWQVRTTDSTSRVSPWSSSLFFTPRSAPSAPSITAPSSGATVTAFTLSPLTWTNTSNLYTQARRVGDDGSGNPDPSTVYEDSGVQSTTGSAWTFGDAIAHPGGGAEHWQVREANYPGLWSAWADLPVTLALSKPMRPTITGRVDAASVTLIVGNPATKSGFVATDHNDITRTWDGQTVTIATGLPLGAVFVDQLPGPGANDYTAIAYTADGVPNTSY